MMTQSRRTALLFRAVLVSLPIFWCSSVWAPPMARPAFHPIEVRPVEPPKQVESVKESDKIDVLKDPNAPLPKPTGTASTQVESPWHRITDSLGAPTNSIQQAYVALIVLVDGRGVLTTNYTQTGQTEAQTIILQNPELFQADALVPHVARLLGPNVQVSDLPVKIVLTQAIDSDQFNMIFDKKLQTFRIDMSNFRSAELYTKDGANVYLLEKVNRPKPPPRWMAKLNKCCVFTGIPPDFTGWNRLHDIPFKKDSARVISLFPDAATAKALKDIGDSKNIVHPDQIKTNPEVAIREAFASGDAGSPVVVIGHVAGGAFRVEGADGFDISFEMLTNLARDTGRPLFLIGCYTADQFQAPVNGPANRDYAVGTVNLLYPREVAPKVVAALKSSSNVQALVEHMSDPALYLWISSDFLVNADSAGAKTLRAPIYKDTTDGKRSIVGFLFVYLPCKLLGACA
ncbi:hypothetical protein E2553_30700 [Paraburkholderia dipogonis]|uniref:Uncharacterized protein n=1 Tax=Paraburkholderia dipogonis TaxID=1211383 RepID=A0A4Y8MUH1_9BURK|nr:hypothetical protein [Paraburkholderia dipogonis]TFE41069.1 hypothetical protein E2553_30700 [Paraburkholderia dipogonis]